MIRLLFLFVFFLPTSLFGQKGESVQISLKQVLETALANAPEINIAMYDVAKAEKDVNNAWAEVFPNISGSFNYTRNREVPVSFLPAIFFDPSASPDDLIPVAFGTDNNWQTGFSVSQNLFKGDALVGIASATIYKLVQQENLRAVAQRVVTNTRLAYYTVLVRQNQYELQKDNIERLRQNLADNQRRLDLGVIDEFQVLQLEVELKNEEPLLATAENALVQAYRELKFVAGMPANLTFEVLGDLLSLDLLNEKTNPENAAIYEIDAITPFAPYSPTNDLENSLAARGDIRTIKAQSSLKDKEIMAYKSRLLPELTANYNYQWVAAEAGPPNLDAILSPNQLRARFQTIGVSAKVTLFNGLQRMTVIQKAQIEKKQIEEQKNMALRSAENELMNSVDGVMQSKLLIPAYQEALDAATRGYNISRNRFENGFGSQIDVLNAEIALKRAQLNRITAVYNYLSAKAQYDLAIGQVPFIDTSFNP